MKSILISVIILISISSALSAQNLSQDEASIYDSAYFNKIQIKNDALNNIEKLAIEINSRDNNNYEVELSVNKYFKPFVVMGAKISEFLSGFNFSDLGLGLGANLQLSESICCYAKYSSATRYDEKSATIKTSAMYIGMGYDF